MKKRTGRPKMDEAERKGVQISIRLTPALLESLKSAAKANDVPAAKEIVERLAASLDPARQFHAEDFGTPQTYSLMLLMAAAISDLEKLTGERWQTNRFTHDEAVKAVEAVIKSFRPKGALKPPANFPDIPYIAADPDFKKLMVSKMIAQGVGATCAGIVLGVMRRSPGAAAQFQLGKATRRLRHRFNDQHLPHLFSSGETK